MADLFDSIEETHRRFIEEQHLFFVATAPSDMKGEGWPNLSPKGRSLVHVLGPNLVGWLDYPGSGNATAEQSAENGKITLMFCSFGKTAGILRLFGRGRCVDLDDPLLAEHRDAFRDDAHPYVRQAFFVDVEKVQTSCGYGVPGFEYVADRDTLDRWCERNFEPREMADGMPAAGEMRRH